MEKLGTTFDETFFAIASVAGPGIVNAAAFSSTVGVQRQSATLPKLQIEPSLGLILPRKGEGDERLGMPLYAVNLVGGYRFDETNAIQARGFYLPEISFSIKSTPIAFQPISFGATYTRRIKPHGGEWYNPAIIAPLDVAYMHGSLSAAFAGSKTGIAFDPSGSGKTATATINYSDNLNLKWDVFTFTTGLILAKPLFEIFTVRAGILTSLNFGRATLANTAVLGMTVTSSNGSGTQEFKTGDTASLSLDATAKFNPLFVTNQITFGASISLGAATLNLDLAQNIQLNATAIILQLGCWF